MSTLSLSISTKYVSHWGLWEAIRELLQNALDAEVKGHRFYYRDSPGGLIIGNEGITLPRETLLLGMTDKDKAEDQVGKFGEGYKLALLVLCRLGHQVTIWNGDEIWTPLLAHDENFGAEVLKIGITDRQHEEDDGGGPFDGIQFVIPGVKVADIADKWKPDLPIDTPMANRKGEIYVRGLHICIVEGFHCGYNFSPGKIKLDRDRGMVDGFDLSYQTSKIWAAGKTDDENSGLASLLEKEAPDVRYVTSHAAPTSPAMTYVVESFRSRYPNAIPVSDQKEIERIQAAGKKWVLVPPMLKDILWRTVGYFIPSVGTPKQRLADFLERNKYSFTPSMRKELEDILEAM